MAAVRPGGALDPEHPSQEIGSPDMSRSALGLVSLARGPAEAWREQAQLRCAKSRVKKRPFGHSASSRPG